MSLASFPVEYFAPLGAIIVNWGGFESDHNHLLTMLANARGITDIPNGFERKRKRLKTEFRAEFYDCPFLVEYLVSTLGEAKTIYPKRNILAHGNIWTEVEVNTGNGSIAAEIVLLAKGEKDGQYTEERFKIQDLKVICYNIMHISGKIRDFLTSPALVYGAPLRELRRLQDFQDIHLGSVPNASIRPAQPAPPQG